MISSGARANATGRAFEDFVEDRLLRLGYREEPRETFSLQATAPTYARQLPLVGIYGTIVYADYALVHPQKHPAGLILECKWQEASGSVDEKFPYLVANIKERYPYPTIVLADGGGMREGAAAWLRAQVGGQLLRVFNMMELQRWTNGGAL